MNIDFTQVKNASDAEKAEARAWRDSELKRADIQLNKVQDGSTGLGSVSDWRKYRVLLRDWPDTQEFPKDPPASPDLK